MQALTAAQQQEAVEIRDTFVELELMDADEQGPPLFTWLSDGTRVVFRDGDVELAPAA